MPYVLEGVLGTLPDVARLVSQLESSRSRRNCENGAMRVCMRASILRNSRIVRTRVTALCVSLHVRLYIGNEISRWLPTRDSYTRSYNRVYSPGGVVT